jgi:hypothetical protein
VGTEVSGRGSLFVEGEETGKYEATANAENPGADYAKALESNLTWAVQRAFQWNNKSLSGLKVSHSKTDSGYNFHVEVAGDLSPESESHALQTTTLLLPVQQWFNVKISPNPQLTGVPDPKSAEDFLVKGLTAFLACQHKNFLDAAKGQNFTVHSVDYEAEFEIDTRGFVYGAGVQNVTPKVKDLYFKGKVNSTATPQQIKAAGATAAKTCKMFNHYTKNGTTIASRWTK